MSHGSWKGLYNIVEKGYLIFTDINCYFYSLKKTRKEREYSFPIRTALIHRLKVRMMPFKDADKHAKVFLEKFMDIVALFLMPLSYITFKSLACMIDFMFALSTLTNQAEVLKSTQKSALKNQLQDDVSSGSIALGENF